MATVSAEQREIARKGFAFLLQRLSDVGGEAVAEAIGVSPATVSRTKNEDLERVVLLIAALGGKVVPVGSRCFLPADIEPLLALAKARMDQLQSVDQLRWDE